MIICKDILQIACHNFCLVFHKFLCLFLYRKYMNCRPTSVLFLYRKCRNCWSFDSFYIFPRKVSYAIFVLFKFLIKVLKLALFIFLISFLILLFWEFNWLLYCSYLLNCHCFLILFSLFIKFIYIRYFVVVFFL